MHKNAQQSSPQPQRRGSNRSNFAAQINSSFHQKLRDVKVQEASEGKRNRACPRRNNAKSNALVVPVWHESARSALVVDVPPPVDSSV